ncbi:MAG: histidinol-phosphate transaminase [Betaproteobacteria bacterium]|nr:histidinol-phosphate transaminase [Betaproteobacteria bacterium]
MSTQYVVRPEISELTSYHVQPAAGLTKLDAMENPFAFPESLRAGLSEALAKASLNRYPPAGADALKQATRNAMQVPGELDILLGNGSDEIIQLIAMAAAKPGATLLSVEPAFVMFKMIATFCGLRYVGVPLRADFTLDVEATVATVRESKPAVTFLAYPNNPTGNLFDRDAIDAVIAATAEYGGLVVIDEAYFAFSTESFLNRITGYPNAVLMRTVSKLGLAGIRLGMLFGRSQWLNEFDKLRLPYNINALTQAAAMFAMQHYDAMLAQTRLLQDERTRLAAALSALPGVTVFPSAANFILVRFADPLNATQTFDALLSRRILVKNTSNAHPLMSNTLRLTVGTPDENDALIAALQELIRP